jgi:hypothetical protein
LAPSIFEPRTSSVFTLSGAALHNGFDFHTLPPHLSDLTEVAKNEAAKDGIKFFDPVLESRFSAARVTTGFMIPLHPLSP